jgi:hypothetical protein
MSRANLYLSPTVDSTQTPQGGAGDFVVLAKPQRRFSRINRNSPCAHLDRRRNEHCGRAGGQYGNGSYADIVERDFRFSFAGCCDGDCVRSDINGRCGKSLSQPDRIHRDGNCSYAFTGSDYGQCVVNRIHGHGVCANAHGRCDEHCCGLGRCDRHGVDAERFWRVNARCGARGSHWHGVQCDVVRRSGERCCFAGGEHGHGAIAHDEPWCGDAVGWFGGGYWDGVGTFIECRSDGCGIDFGNGECVHGDIGLTRDFPLPPAPGASVAGLGRLLGCEVARCR